MRLGPGNIGSSPPLTCAAPARIGMPFRLLLDYPDPEQPVFVVFGPVQDPPLVVQDAALCTGVGFLWLHPQVWLFPVSGPAPFEFEVVLPPDPALIGLGAVAQGTVKRRGYCRSLTEGVSITVLP